MFIEIDLDVSKISYKEIKKLFDKKEILKISTYCEENIEKKTYKNMMVEFITPEEDIKESIAKVVLRKISST